MKRIFLFVLAAFLGTVSSYAKSGPTNEKATENSLLWRISGKGLKKSSYLFGTIHIICKNDYFWTPAMQKSFSATDALCLEMDLDDPTIMMQSMMGMMATDGKMLKDHFTPEQYSRLDRYAKDSLGMGLEMLQTMKPVIVMTLLAQKSGGSGCDSSVSYEMQLMEQAKASEKDVEGLEQVKEQLAALNSLPNDSVVKEIMAIVDGTQQEENTLPALVAAYKAQDLGRLEALISEGDGLMSQKGALLDDRNQRWISRMESKMKSESLFFAVGAAHLPGSGGVIQLLRNAGYTLEPVK